ncbi:MAG TPA: FGGY family carbohydrate kinase [Candidatus Polarisedimenticolia bacterium]|nr:FGGY family carbohydrate kinase [Candidatus Polarisedimenticolia bacterium]
MSCILALDQGTSSSKAAVFDERGRALGVARAAVTTTFGPRGSALQDPEAIVRSQRAAIRAAMARAGNPSLAAAGIASQRSTFVLWDRESGRALEEAPTWQDTSCAAVCGLLAPHAAAVRAITGLPLSAHYSAPKLSRLLSGRPALRRKAGKGALLFGSVATYLLWRLGRGEVHAIDPTLAARTLLFDIQTLAWSPRLARLFGVPPGILPEVRPSLGRFGDIVVEGRRVPVRAMLGDQQAAFLGAVGGGAAGGAEGRALVNYGTGAFALVPTGGRLVRLEGLLSSLAWTTSSRRRYLVEGTINAAGSALEWLGGLIGGRPGLGSLDRLCRQGTGDVRVLASFWGIGSMRVQDGPTQPAAIAGRGGRAPWSRGDLARGTVEGIAHAVQECLDAAARAAPIRSLVASGSLARLPHLMRFQSALAGLPIEISADTEATLRGVGEAVSGGGWPAPGTRRRRVAAAGAERRAARACHAEWLGLAESLSGWGMPR